ncbi:MAG: hypothetical protein HLUCCO16_05355 [Phormidium sp. OSCR]|nr:MAG: hypothetical protein HLUCCO16_05355 [Phormidium sp. OSCR]
MWLILFSLIEICFLCCGFTLLVYDYKNRLSTSIAFGINLAIISLSFIFQLSFLVNISQASFLMEIPLVFVMMGVVWANKQKTKVIAKQIISFISSRPFLSCFTAIPLLYLGIKSIVFPQNTGDVLTYHFPRVFIYQSQNSLFLDNVCKVHHAVFPVGSDILPHAFLRFNTDIGGGFFSFLAYLVIVTGNYALARKYASERLSVAVAFTIASIPQLIFQGWVAKNNVFTASAAIFCLLVVDKLLKSPTSKNLFLLVLGLLFGLAAKTTFLAFAFPFIIFYGLSLIKKYGIKIWLSEIRQNWYWWLAAIVPLGVMSQIWLFIYNHIIWGTWSGPPGFVDFHKNQDGIRGGIANFVRFSFEFIDSTPIPKEKVNEFFGFFDILERIYEILFHPVFGDAGLQGSRIFHLSLITHQGFSSFGLLGVLVLIPCIFMNVWNRTLFSRNLAYTLLLFLVIFCFTSTWSPTKIRMLLLFFACSGACVANSLPRFIKTYKQELIVYYLISSVAILNLFYISLYDLDALVLKGYRPTNWDLKSSDWVQGDWGRDRLYFAEKYHGDERLKILAEFFPEGSRVGFFTESSTRLHYYFLHLPQVRFQSICMDEPHRRNFPSQTFDTLEDAMLTLSPPLDYVLCVGEQCQTPGNQLQERFHFPSEEETLFIFEVLPGSPSE